MGDIAEQLADWSTRYPLDALPPAGLEMLRLSFVDTLGVALAGSPLPAVAMVGRWCTPPGPGEPGASRFGLAGKTRLLDAALLNGTAAHAQLYDDTNMVMNSHVSSPLVPALLALGQTRGSGGRAVAEAYAVGMEVGVKLGRLLNPPLYEAGWHVTNVLGVLGVAAACARLLGLDARRCQMALGIAASMSQGLRQNFGTMTMGLHAGLAARNGLHAALLAADGFDSDADSLEGRYGLFRTFCRWEGGTLAPLGAPHELIASGNLFKPYPSGAPTVAAVDAALAVHRRTGPLAPERVKAIVCHVHPWNFKTLREGLPSTGLFGKVSLRYCVARALHSGSLKLGHFTDAAVREPAVVGLMERMQVQAEPSLPDNGEYPAEIEARLSDGSTVAERRERPLGSAAFPMQAGAVEAKFRDCAQGVIPPKRSEAVLRQLARLLELPTVAPLCEALEA